MHTILPPKCPWAVNTCLLRAFTTASISTLPGTCHLRHHICIAPVPKHEKTKKPPNKQNQTPKTSQRDAGNSSLDPSGFKPNSLVKSAQFNRLEDILQWDSPPSVSIKYLNVHWMRAGAFIPDQCFLGMISHQGVRIWFFLSGQRSI